MGLSRHASHCEASSAPIKCLEDERCRVIVIIHSYAPWNVYNMNETALLYCAVPNNGLAIWAMAGLKLDKTLITYALCANMDRSDKQHLLVTARARQPQCFEKCCAHEMGFYYFSNGETTNVCAKEIYQMTSCVSKHCKMLLSKTTEILVRFTPIILWFNRFYCIHFGWRYMFSAWSENFP
jgi:hypothetical protein